MSRGLAASTVRAAASCTLCTFGFFLPLTLVLKCTSNSSGPILILSPVRSSCSPADLLIVDDSAVAAAQIADGGPAFGNGNHAVPAADHVAVGTQFALRCAADEKFRPLDGDFLPGMLPAENDQFHVHDKLRRITRAVP